VNLFTIFLLKVNLYEFVSLYIYIFQYVFILCTIFIHRRVMNIDNYMIVICILKYKRPSLHTITMDAITIKMFFFS
jgi:hypothetical protein